MIETIQTTLIVIVAVLSALAVWPLLRKADAYYRAMTDKERDETNTW